MNVGVKVATAAAGVLTLALLLYKWSVRSSPVPPSAASGGGQSEGKQQVLVEEDVQQMVVVEEDKQLMVVEEEEEGGPITVGQMLVAMKKTLWVVSNVRELVTFLDLTYQAFTHRLTAEVKRILEMEQKKR